MNVERIERRIARLRLGNHSKRLLKLDKQQLAERRMALADYFFSVSEPILSDSGKQPCKHGSAGAEESLNSAIVQLDNAPLVAQETL